MALAILPDLDIDKHNRLRVAWNDVIESGVRVPSLRGGERSNLEAVLLESDYLRWVGTNPGPEVERRLGAAPKKAAGGLTLGNARVASRLGAYDLGLRGILRLVVLGRSLGAHDLADLIAGGPAASAFRPVFDDAALTVVQAQRDLGVRWGERIRDAVVKTPPAVGRTDGLGMSPGRSIGREFG